MASGEIAFASKFIEKKVDLAFKVIEEIICTCPLDCADDASCPLFNECECHVTR